MAAARALCAARAPPLADKQVESMDGLSLAQQAAIRRRFFERPLSLRRPFARATFHLWGASERASLAAESVRLTARRGSALSLSLSRKRARAAQSSEQIPNDRYELLCIESVALCPRVLAAASTASTAATSAAEDTQLLVAQLLKSLVLR